MIEVKIPADIQEYKSKLIFGLSTRQVIAICAAIVLGGGIGIFGKNYIPSDILPWFVIIAVAPCAGYGWMKFKDMLFEDFMKAFISMNFFPQKRVYEDTDVNLYEELYGQILESDIIEQRINAGEYESEYEQDWSE